MKQPKDVTEEALHILGNLNREFIPKPTLEYHQPIRRKEMLMLIIFICRGMFIYQISNLNWNINKDSSFIRGLLAQLQQDGFIESKIIYENKRYYSLTRKGYNECIDIIDAHFMLIGRRESALASLYDGQEYIPPKNATSNILHRILSNDIHIALSSLRAEGFPEFFIRHEVAVSDNGYIYIRSYDNDIVCDKNKVSLRIDVLFEYANNYIYVEQDTCKQPISVLTDKLNNYANILFANNNLDVQTLTFSIFSGMDILRVVDKPNSSTGTGIVSSELKNLIKRYGEILIGICALHHNKLNVKELMDFVDSSLNYILMYHGGNSSGQIRRMFKLINQLPHNTNVSTILAESLRTEKQYLIDENNHSAIEKRYISRRETVMKAMTACKAIHPYIYKGLTINCVPNVTETSNRLKLSLLSTIPHVYKTISAGLKRTWIEAEHYEHNSIFFNHVIDAEGATIVIENISDDLSGRLRITNLIQNSMSGFNASIICVCENHNKALEYVKEHKHAAFSNIISRTDALLSNKYKGIIFVFYSALLNGRFEPTIYISGTDNIYTEYSL